MNMGAYHCIMPRGGGVPGVVHGGAPAEEVPGDELRRPAAVGSPRHEPHRLGRHFSPQSSCSFLCYRSMQQVGRKGESSRPITPSQLFLEHHGTREQLPQLRRASEQHRRRGGAQVKEEGGRMLCLCFWRRGGRGGCGVAASRAALGRGRERGEGE